MKKLVMVTVESVFSGRVLSGVAELVDSLANSLSKNYNVTIICPYSNSVFARTASNLRKIENDIYTCRFSAVDYYMIDSDLWFEKVAYCVEKIQPDILHNFAEPEIIDVLHTRPKKVILTFDHAYYVRGKEEYLLLYDSVTTSSENYAKEVLAVNDTLSNVLSNINFEGITAGILDVAFSPEKGVLISNKYTADNQEGKQSCKQRLIKMYGIQDNPYICLMMCRLVKEKGIEQVFDSIKTIRDTGGILVVVGKGEHQYEQQLRKYRQSDGVVYIDRWASPVQAAPLTAGSDFYLCPSIAEVCGLMPMTASRYGAIPIVTLNGGLADNFNNNNAIIIDDKGIDDAIIRASQLYVDNTLLMNKRKICMEQDFSWTSRKIGYINLYEKE